MLKHTAYNAEIHVEKAIYAQTVENVSSLFLCSDVQNEKILKTVRKSIPSQASVRDLRRPATKDKHASGLKDSLYL